MGSWIKQPFKSEAYMISLISDTLTNVVWRGEDRKQAEWEGRIFYHSLRVAEE